MELLTIRAEMWITITISFWFAASRKVNAIMKIFDYGGNSCIYLHMYFIPMSNNTNEKPTSKNWNSSFRLSNFLLFFIVDLYRAHYRWPCKVIQGQPSTQWRSEIGLGWRTNRNFQPFFICFVVSCSLKILTHPTHNNEQSHKCESY